MKYYFLNEKFTKDCAFANPVVDIGPSYELIEEVKTTSMLPFKLQLMSVGRVKGELVYSSDLSKVVRLWFDFQPNTLAWLLFSAKLKTIIDRNLTGSEHLAWIEAPVDAMGDDHVYYVPVFRKKLNVLDIEKTSFVPGTNHIIKPCFSLEKVSSFSVFPKPGKFSTIPTGMYLNDTIRKEMIAEGISGVGFSETTVA